MYQTGINLAAPGDRPSRRIEVMKMTKGGKKVCNIHHPHASNRLMRYLFVALLRLAALMADAQPTITYRDSLEWATMDSDLIVTGRIVAVRAPGKSARGTTIVTLKVDETIKGPKLSEVVFATTSETDRDGHNEIEPLCNSGKEILLFLMATDRNIGYRSGRPNEMAPYCTHASSTAPFTYLDLDPTVHAKIPTLAMTMDFKPITQPQAVLSATKKLVKQNQPASPPCRLGWNIWGLDPTKPNLNGWSGYDGMKLTVPANAHLESLARGWIKSSDINTRFVGLLALEPFPSKTNEALINQLLQRLENQTAEANTKPVVTRMTTEASRILKAWNKSKQ